MKTRDMQYAVVEIHSAGKEWGDLNTEDRALYRIQTSTAIMGVSVHLATTVT